MVRETSRNVFHLWWSLFSGAAGLDSGALFKCLLLFDLLTELHRGSAEWKHKIVQNQGNHIRNRQERGKGFLFRSWIKGQQTHVILSLTVFGSTGEFDRLTHRDTYQISWRTPSLITIFVWIILPLLGHIFTFEWYYRPKTHDIFAVIT